MYKLKKLKVCFWGLGSIGKRHLNNLVKISEEFNLKLEIHAYRETKTELPNDISNLIDNQIFEVNCLSNDYDITFITNPTSEHYKTMEIMTGRTKHFFIEKPIFDKQDYDMDTLQLNENGIHYVAGPLRHSDVIQELKKILLNEKVYSIRSICSSYLPNWRKGIDYRKTYSSNKVQGGGVSIDLIHEWDYIADLFGFPDETFNLQGKFSNLEIDSEDISIYIAKYKDKLVEIHLDYFGRVPRRTIEIFTEQGTITGDFINKNISFSDGRKIIDFNLNSKDMYIEEMRYFIESVLKEDITGSNLEHSYKVLKLAMGEI